jgi:hypothetical protein
MRATTAYAAGLSWFPDTPAVSRARLGNATDDARQARADYFGNLARNGNVAAARIIIGGTQNTSGNESPIWSAWIDALRQTPLGLQTLQAAQYLGAWWPVGSSDTTDNYPIMRAFVAAWAADNKIAPPPIVATPQAAPVTQPAAIPEPPEHFSPPVLPSSAPVVAPPIVQTIGGLTPAQWATVAGGAVALGLVVTLVSPSRR